MEKEENDIPLREEQDFNDFISSGNRVVFKHKEKKVIQITNWRKRIKDFEDKTTKEIKKTTIFVADVIKENGIEVKGKELRETSKRFAKEIMPIIMKAIKNNKSTITIAVTKKEELGNPMATEWWIEEVGA